MGAGEWEVAARGGWNIFIGMMKMFRNLIIVMNVRFFGHIKNQSRILLKDCATWYVNYILINLILKEKMLSDRDRKVRRWKTGMQIKGGEEK